MSSRYRSIGLRLPTDDLAEIDAERGLVPREAWLRHLIDLGRQARASNTGSEMPASPSNRADMFRQATQRRSK